MSRSSTLSTGLLALVVVAVVPVIGKAVWDVLTIRELASIDHPVAVERAPHPRPAKPRPAPRPRAELAPVDRAVFRYLDGWGSDEPRSDVVPDAPFRVDLTVDPELGRGARVDLDRDGQWDEVWRFAPLTKQVSPEDDGHATASFAWDGTAWQPQ